MFKRQIQKTSKATINWGTQIPNYSRGILHIDIYSTDNKYFLTCIDKFSKFAIVQPMPSRTIIDVKPPYN